MARVKLISGKFGGRWIDTPGGGTHPMSERARAAVFNMLGEFVEGRNVLDAFAGSGALGFEALSRGARKVVFIDSSPNAITTIRRNSRSLGVEDRVRCERARLSVNNIERGTVDEQYDLVFVDPPYLEYNIGVLRRIIGYLRSGGRMVVSYPTETEVPNLDAGLELMSKKAYANAGIAIYNKM